MFGYGYAIPRIHTLSEGGGVPTWADRDNLGLPALLTIDAANDRGYFNGRSYASEAALLAAAGGSKSGLTRLFGPYVAPDATELFPNGDMSAGYTGWTNQNSATGAVVDGELVLTAGGVTSGRAVSPAVSVVDGYGYLMSAKTRRGTNAINVGVTASTSVSISPGVETIPLNTTTTDVVGSQTLASEGASLYLALAAGGVNATGTVIGDDFSVKRADPLINWTPTKQALQIEFTTPSAVAAIKTLATFEGKQSSGSRSVWKLYIDTDLHIKVQMTSRGTLRATMDLGLVGLSEAHTVDMAYHGPTFRCYAQLDNREMIAAPSSTVLMGACVIRIARSAAGETWDGGVTKFSVFNKVVVPPRTVVLAGDSYSSGSPGMWSGLTAAGRPCQVVIGSGGTDLTTQVGHFANSADYLNGVVIWWDGDANRASADPASDLALYAQGLAYLGHSRFLIIPSLRRANNSSNWANTTARANALFAAYPNNTYDAQTFLATLSDGSAGDLAAVAGGYVPPSCLGDGTHLTATAANAVMAQVKSWLDGKGW